MSNPIIGNTTATPYPRPDWNQTDSSKADYIKNKPVLSKVATTGSYNDLKDKPDSPGGGGGSTTNSINYSDIDNTLDCGIYLVDGRDGVLDDSKKEMLVVSASDRGIGQFYFYDDGRIMYRQYQDGWGSSSEIDITNYKSEIERAVAALVDSAPEKLNTLDELAAALNDDPNFANTILTELGKKANDSDLSTVAKSGSYNDLIDKPEMPELPDLSEVATTGSYKDLLNQPITVLDNYPSQSEIDNMLSGIWVYKNTNEFLGSGQIIILAHCQEDWVYDENGIPVGKVYSYNQCIIRDSRITLRNKVAVSGEADITPHDWEDRPLATNNDISQAIAELSAVAKSGSYNDLKDKLEVKQSYASSNDQPISGVGVKQALETLSDVAHSGKYGDLSNKPITVLDYYPTNEQLEQMGEGIYLAVVADKTVPDYMYFFSTREEWENDNGVGYKHQSWIVTIIGDNGIRVERKDSYCEYDDHRADVTIDWREVPLNENTATKDDIGDIETALDEIVDEFHLDTAITLEISESSTHSEKPTALAVKNYVDNAIGDVVESKVLVSNGDTITLKNNTTYYAKTDINSLTINYPDDDFISTIQFTLASDGDITITLPESKYIGGSPTFANGETWEINIKNGVVVGGLVE